MRNYENYTPEINYNDDPLEAVVDAGTPPVKNSDGKSKRKKNNVRISKEVKPAAKSVQTRKPSPFKGLKGFFTGTGFRLLSGLFLGCLAVYLGVAFCGYFSTCIEDQSKIASSAIGSAPPVANPGGEGGARLSELLINESFGFGSLVIVVWLGALSLRLLTGKPRFRTVDFTIKCLVALITVSLIIGLLTYSLHTPVNWGGYHGTYVNEWIIRFIGSIGAVLLSIFMVALFVVICLRDLVNWIIRKRRARAERRRVQAEERAAAKAKEEEIRRMAEQEQIDDLKAGESAVISAESHITDMQGEEPEDGPLEFGADDTPLYTIPDAKQENDSEDVTGDIPLNNELSNNEQGGIDENNVTEAEDTAIKGNLLKSNEENIINNSEPEDRNASSEDQEPDKMVVNVNTIGQSSRDRFVGTATAPADHKYKFPPYDILRPGKERVKVDADEQLENKRRIEKTLLDFGIKITSIEATIGPTVTLYEIVPAPGVKISNIRNLVDDIALSLSARGVRIIAPIPGKGTVGIEVANREPQMVSMRTVIQSKKYQESKYYLPVALGSTISNEVYIADLAKMPHLLVAGATGQGKSVGLNALITSILYCKAPHEVKFVMIDPKQVEFSLYNKLKNYYMAMIPSQMDDEPVITDSARVETVLSSLVLEMEIRYGLLKNAHVRNIEEYNGKIKEGNLNPADGHRFLPYLVLIVDEFGDLVMELKKNVELPIARLAQKARAVGMHVIIATQRPSTDVITGIIKANFPARISFKVASGVDSKTILDTSGAQQLIGRGDMLIFNSSEMVRVQCAFIDTPEVEEICEYVERQPYPQGIYELPEPIIEGKGDADGTLLTDRDPLFQEVARAVVSSGRASTSNVQRNYEIGYNRAGRIMDQLEAAGIVGPSLGGKPRAVLVDPIKLEEILASLN